VSSWTCFRICLKRAGEYKSRSY